MNISLEEVYCSVVIQQSAGYVAFNCTRCVQKVSRILNFRGLRIFDFDFFVALCWYSCYSFMPSSTAILNVQLIFDSCFACTFVVFGFVFDFCLFQKMNQRIWICVKNKIKCVDVFGMLTVAYGEATLDRSNVYRWSKIFSEARENVKNECVPDDRARQQQTKTLMKWRK